MGVEQGLPFVVAVASVEKGAGKTVLASNLAVYLKALREDLPVTLASFDRRFDIRRMFELGGLTGAGVADLFKDGSEALPLALGQYGVQYLQPDPDPGGVDPDEGLFSRALRTRGISGILVLDTTALTDDLTRMALSVADLVLSLVSTRVGLAGTAFLETMLQQSQGDASRLFLLCNRIHDQWVLGQGMGLREFLERSARERGYQVFDAGLPYCARLEELGEGRGERIHPVITHALRSPVHERFFNLASFVIERFENNSGSSLVGAALPGGLRVGVCPACAERTFDRGAGFRDLRSRRRGWFHRECIAEVFDDLFPLENPGELALMVLSHEEPGLAESEELIRAHFFDLHGQWVGTEAAAGLRSLMARAAGCCEGELLRDLLIIHLEDPSGPRSGKGETFSALRVRALRTLVEHGFL